MVHVRKELERGGMREVIHLTIKILAHAWSMDDTQR
jgi:hypothetical protein